MDIRGKKQDQGSGSALASVKSVKGPPQKIIWTCQRRSAAFAERSMHIKVGNRHFFHDKM